MTLDKHALISLFHVLFVGPLLLYLGLTKGNLSNFALWVVVFLGAGVSLYHLTKTIQLGLKQGWIYALHALVFAPLLIYVGLKGKQAFYAAFSVLLMLGFATMGYHGLHLAKLFIRMVATTKN